jgi:hypothetical protein
MGRNANRSELGAKDIDLVRREIQEIREALEAFKGRGDLHPIKQLSFFLRGLVYRR